MGGIGWRSVETVQFRPAVYAVLASTGTSCSASIVSTHVSRGPISLGETTCYGSLKLSHLFILVHSVRPTPKLFTATRCSFVNTTNEGTMTSIGLCPRPFAARTTADAPRLVMLQGKLTMCLSILLDGCGVMELNALNELDGLLLEHV